MGFFKFGKRKQENAQVPVTPVPVTPLPPVVPTPVPVPVPPVVPVPLPTVPPVEPKYVYDERNLLVKPAPKMVRNFRADPIVDADCPTAVEVPSGHYVSVPRPDLGETFMGYAMRVVFQVGKDEIALNGIGAMFLGTEGCFKPFGGWKADGSNWPQAADVWFNGATVIMTEAEKAKAEEERLAAEKQWEEHWAAKERARQEAASSGGQKPHRPVPVEPAPVVTPTEPSTPIIPEIPTANTVDGEIEIEISKE